LRFTAFSAVTQFHTPPNVCVVEACEKCGRRARGREGSNEVATECAKTRRAQNV
jgi:hypothetical protein